MSIEQLYEIFRQHPVITTDSRHCPEGSLFFALKGDKFDGNDYIEQTLTAGVAYAVGDRSDLSADERIIQVDNVLQTLQNLANYHRRQMNATVIAITGTNGKTTTKELIATALSSKYKTLYTQGNLNNHIGVPLTLLQLKPEHEFAVIEMGANHPREIRELCLMAEPDYGLITNVGKAHLEGFGSLEGVVRTKTELYDFLREKGGTVFGNSDNLILKDLYAYLSMVYYGTSSEAFIQGKITASAPTLAFEWKNEKNEGNNKILTHLVGSYNFENVLAAICVANYFGVEDEKINDSIASYIPTNNRSQNQKTGKNELIIDAYNANPSSMQAALDNFKSLDVSPKMVILGEMKELGNYNKEEHQKLVESLSSPEKKMDKVWLVGENFKECSSLNPEWQVFSKTDDLLAYLQTTSLSGYFILIKGSRGNQLEKVIPYL
ncbi:MAG: UDP-N-acetylmuramoyl-tripeptide--D-alanyl-D-alanine ligase [Candidatus Symbiothrix sp.]|jgi:UDP-N-acetylmuramoyl-tripeptide--D-alanyl-D-alanine ligase|nr:UDP-N-acetylmuramoyl-tripeptide--D-alanyl-D-alanine ligase [Candidatus Symbiothrix sp.]